MTFYVKITRRCKADRDKCFDFIAERSPEGALRWLDAFEDAAQSLPDDPFHGEAPESENHEETIRQRMFKTRSGRNYRILYVIRGNMIYVIHVRGHGQDVMKVDEIQLPIPLED